MAKDLSQRQFNAAIERNGFRRIGQTFWFSHDATPGRTYSGVTNRHGEINYRASLARMLRDKRSILECKRRDGR